MLVALRLVIIFYILYLCKLPDLSLGKEHITVQLTLITASALGPDWCPESSCQFGFQTHQQVVHEKITKILELALGILARSAPFHISNLAIIR